jgi:hypothetical protein
MNKYQYLNEKFCGAVRHLALSTESLQDRLAEAYIHHLIHVKNYIVPEGIKEKFELLYKNFASGVSNITIEETVFIIDDILDMAQIIHETYRQDDRKD